MSTTFRVRVWTRFLTPLENIAHLGEQGDSIPGALAGVLYSRFEHQHIFETTRDGSRYIEDIVFTPALPVNKATALATLWRYQRRHKGLARTLPADERTVGTGVMRVLVEELEEDDD